MYHPFLSRRWFKQQAKSSYARVTLNWTTALFFVFSHLYCFAQGMVQSLFFSTDLEYSTLVDSIVHGGHIPVNNMSFLQGSPGHLYLQMCNGVPGAQSPYPCTTIFNSSADSPIYNHTLSPFDQPVRVLKASKGALPIVDTSSNVTSLIVFNDPQPFILTNQCIQILQYPSQTLQNLRREDITWISLQFWLLAISFIAIVTQSVPHVLAVLSTRTLSAAWAAYAIWRGPYLKAIFHELLADPGTPCSLDLFTNYWNDRQVYQIADLILNCTGLVFFAYLSWNLLKTYNSQSFKCVGAPEQVINIHKYLMTLLANLQLETFVLIASTAIWVDVLTSAPMSHISPHATFYETIFVIFFLPWITMGWYAIRHEMKRTMILFILTGFTITSGWGIMFSSTAFRWTFLQWPFLACFTVFSFVLLFITIILGVVCRLNFGKGLREYLHAESALASLNFAPDTFPCDRSSSATSNSKTKSMLECPMAASCSTLKIPSSDVLNLKFPSSASHLKSPSSSSSSSSSSNGKHPPPYASSALHLKSPSHSSTLKRPPSLPSSPSFEFTINSNSEGGGGLERVNSAQDVTSIHLDLDEYFMQDREFSNGAFGFGDGFNGGIGYVGCVNGHGGKERGSEGLCGGTSGLRDEQQQVQRPATVVVPQPTPLPLAHSSSRPRELTKSSGYTIGRDWKAGGGWEEDSEMGRESPVPF